MAVVLTHKEMSCLVVGMFDDLVGRFRINIGDIKIFARAVCFNLTLKGLCLSLSHTTYCNRRLLSSFQTKTFPLNQVLKIDAIVV